MPDLIERLAAANPVDQCSPLPLEVLRTALIDEPRRRDQRASVLSLRLAFGGSALTVAAALAVALVIALGSGSSLVSKAYAATSNTRTILHYTVSEREIGRGLSHGRAVQSPGATTVSQVWSSGSRWHAIESTPAFTSAFDRTTKSMVEQTEDGDTELRYSSQFPKTINRLEFSDSGCGSVAFELAQGACGDPIRQLHALLSTGALRPAGKIMFDGNRVDVLSGAVRGRLSPHRLIAAVRVLVNPTSYIPIQVRATQTVPYRHYGGGTRFSTFINTENFGHFQRLSITSANLRLLNLNPHPGARVITTKCSQGCLIRRR